jgi:hypothetical protein
VKILIISLVILGIFCFLSSLNWRYTVKAVLFVVVIEGVLRKWVFPQASELIYFLKEFVLVGAYINYYAFSKLGQKYFFKKSLFNILFFFVLAWCLFHVFNPALGSPLLGVFGLKTYILYIPLIWILPNLFQSEVELYKFLRMYLLLTIPVCILGILQFFSPASSPLNIYANHEVVNVVTFASTEHVRVTGTFSYITGYGIYLLVCLGLLISLVTTSQSGWWRCLFTIEIVLIAINSLMTGSRGVVIAEVLFVLGYLGANTFFQSVSTQRLFKQFLLLTLVLCITVPIWFGSAVNVFWMRTTSSDNLSERIMSNLEEPFQFIKYKELDGYGVGATHQATPVIRKVLKLPNGEFIPTGYEMEMGKIILEIGPIGFLLWYGLRVSIAVALWSIFLKLKKPFLRQLALTAFLIQISQFTEHLVFNHTFSVYYWFFSGFVFLLPQLEQTENWYRSQYIIQHNASSTYITGSPDS